MSHRIHTDLYRQPKDMPDPGNGGTIRVTEDLQICEMVSVAAETRTLANPTKSGIRFVLRMNGQPWLSAAIARKNGNNTLSHFVTVATRT